MKFQGTVLKEQGVTFAVVIVKNHVVDSPSAARDSLRAFQPLFAGIPIVLMGQDPRGVPSYRGRPDLVRFLANTPLAAIPWREYSV
jgi:hypothetical protein